MYFLIINVMIMLCLFLAKNWAHCYLNKIVDKRNGKELIRCTMDSNRSHIDKELFRFILITKLMKFNQVSVENYPWKRIMWRESKSLSGWSELDEHSVLCVEKWCDIFDYETKINEIVKGGRRSSTSCIIA